MRFLIDTMVLAEPARPAPDSRVLAWFTLHPALDLAISCLSLGEIRKGISLLRSGPRRLALERWLAHDLPAEFRERVLPIDGAAALAWGQLDADGKRRGRPLPVVDGLLLATALANDLTFVTRNTRDCADRGVPVVNPWETDG